MVTINALQRNSFEFLLKVLNLYTCVISCPFIDPWHNHLHYHLFFWWTILILMEHCNFIYLFEKTLVFSYFSHIFDLYIQLYNPDRFPWWCDSVPPDSSDDTPRWKTLCNSLVWGNLIIRNISNEWIWNFWNKTTSNLRKANVCWL